MPVQTHLRTWLRISQITLQHTTYAPNKPLKQVTSVRLLTSVCAMPVRTHLHSSNRIKSHDSSHYYSHYYCVYTHNTLPTWLCAFPVHTHLNSSNRTKSHDYSYYYPHYYYYYTHNQTTCMANCITTLHIHTSIVLREQSYRGLFAFLLTVLLLLHMAMGWLRLVGSLKL